MLKITYRKIPYNKRTLKKLKQLILNKNKSLYEAGNRRGRHNKKNTHVKL